MGVKGRLVPVPNLDDRDFRAIKDAMIRAIPEKTPEWTDWNLSDPGITLIELFAHQIEELIVRLNQVLPKHLREYLNLIGVTLTPPSTARVFCFFKMTVKPTFTIAIPKGFEVSTAAAPGEKEQVFTTDEEVLVHPARVHRCFADHQGTLTEFTTQARGEAGPFNPLPAVAVGDALYVAYNENNYFQKLLVSVAQPAVDLAGVWEYLRAHPDGTRSWEALAVTDGTEGLTRSGAVEFEIPKDWDAFAVGDVRATWLRFRIATTGRRKAALRSACLRERPTRDCGVSSRASVKPSPRRRDSRIAPALRSRTETSRKTWRRSSLLKTLRTSLRLTTPTRVPSPETTGSSSCSLAANWSMQSARVSSGLTLDRLRSATSTARTREPRSRISGSLMSWIEMAPSNLPWLSTT